MRGEFDGPTWWDCAQASAVLIETYGKAVSYVLVPPIRRIDGRGYSTWTVAATVSPRRGLQGRAHSRQAAFGKGGSHKTAPAALHWCLLELIAQLDQDRAVAESQAAF